MKKSKLNAASLSSAEMGVCIDAENTVAVSEPQTGDTGFDAGSEEKMAEFERLIEKEYKKQFSDKVQKIISRRLREVKELKEKATKDAAIVEMLMKKFNIEDGDTDKLERMIDETMSNSSKNDSVQSDANIRLMRKLIAENGYLKQNREKQLREVQKINRKEKLKREVMEANKAYSDFDFEKELENPEFCRLLRAGVSVKNAYEVVNMDNILDGKSKETEKKVIDSIRFKENRPLENGSSLTGGVLLSNGISKLTKKQRADLAKRAARGEKIEF